MKLIFSAVLVASIFSTYSREVPDKPDKWDITSTEETLELNEESLLYPDGPFVGLNSSDLLQEIMEEGEMENKRNNRALKNNLKTLMEKLNKIDKELADGKSEQEIQLGSMNNTLIEIQSQNTKIEKLIDAIIGNGPISTELPTTQHTTTTMQPTTTSGCGVGLFQAAGSSQCYKFFYDARRSHTEAKEKCISEGLVIAEPANIINVRNYLNGTYGPIDYPWIWLGARANGVNLVWERSGRKISNTDPLWFWESGLSRGREAIGHCLEIVATKQSLEDRPNSPYYSSGCTQKLQTLCEDINE